MIFLPKNTAVFLKNSRILQPVLLLLFRRVTPMLILIMTMQQTSLLCFAYTPRTSVNMSWESPAILSDRLQRPPPLFSYSFPKRHKLPTIPTQRLEFQTNSSPSKVVLFSHEEPPHYTNHNDNVDSSELTSLTATNNENDNIINGLLKQVFLGIEPSPEILAIMSIYFVEGALGLARLAQTFLLKDSYGLGPAELSAYTGLFTLPWTIKPLYGFLSDSVPFFGYQRRSYLILCGIIGTLSYGIIAFSNTLPLLQLTIASLITSSACIAFSDVVADGIVVQRTRDSNDLNIAGGLQSLCWGSAAIGSLISSYFSGSLLEVMTPQQVFGITAILPAIVAFIAFFITEEESLIKSNLGIKGIQTQTQSLWKAIQSPLIWKPALFVFLWQSTPTSDGAFLFFMTNDLHFGPEFLGRVRLVTSAAALIGVWGYQQFLRTVPIKDILIWTSVASAPLGLIQLLLITHANRSLGIPDGAFVFGDDVVLAILGEFAFLPILVLAAKICPKGIEAVLFATLMSIFNGASTVGTELGAVLTKYLQITESNFDNMALLTILCSLSSLFPLFFIGLLDDVVGTKSEADMEQQDLE